MAQEEATRPVEHIARRSFFFSGVSLRCDVFKMDGEDEYLARTETVLVMDQRRGIVAHEPYDVLIPELLDEYFRNTGK